MLSLTYYWLMFGYDIQEKIKNSHINSKTVLDIAPSTYHLMPSICIYLDLITRRL
jgi:hypothetical protein